MGDNICLEPEKEQIRHYAEAFYGLSKLFEKMPCQKEHLGDAELEAVMGEVKEQVCTGCENEISCWTSRYMQSCRFFYEALCQMQETGDILIDKLPYGEAQCPRLTQILQGLHQGYREARMNLMWRNRMMEQRMAAGEQIFQTAELLRKVSEGFVRLSGKEQKIQRRLIRELKSLGIELLKIRIFQQEKGRNEVYLILKAYRHICISAKTVAEVLGECIGAAMCPAWNCSAAVCDDPREFHFVPDTRYQMFCGISRITKNGELISGDNYSFLQKDPGKVVMSLSDGMGCGAAASRESERVLELLEQFLEAGFPQETAVRMINSCLLLQDQSQMFSTIDLCMTDLYNAECDMLKSGAVSSYIFKGNEIEVIKTESLPAGIVAQADYTRAHRSLKSGHSVIMMTDGVWEALPEEDREQKMAELVGRCFAQNAKEYARRLMERVYLMQKMKPRDDMTVMIGTIWEKA